MIPPSLLKMGETGPEDLSHVYVRGKAESKITVLPDRQKSEGNVGGEPFLCSDEK